MRFNEKRTCLDFLDKGIPENIHLIKPSWSLGRIEQMKRDIIQSFPIANHKLHFGDKVQYITVPFYQAFAKAKEKLVDILENEEIVGTGTFIMQVESGITKTLFYWINKKKNEKAFDAIFFSFTKGFDMIAVDFAVQYKKVSDKDEDGVDVNYFVGGMYDKFGIGYKQVTGEWIAMVAFLKYCDIETRVLLPKGKFKDKIGTRYFNEQKQNVEILDCLWFTNLVVSGEFWVSGHLRWQPFKNNNEWTKKLIWISDFKKEGYIRKAKAS